MGSTSTEGSCLTVFSSIIHLYRGVRMGNCWFLPSRLPTARLREDGAELNNGNYDIKGVSASRHFPHGTQVGSTW